MKTDIYVNLPVKDLGRSAEFFRELGYRFNPQFTNQDGACMIIDKNIYAMLLTEETFRRFINKKAIANARKSVEAITCITLASRQKVDEWASKAISLGATENIVPDMQQGDTMYGRSLNDLDGHIWEVMWMDPKMTQKSGKS